ncbi:hypothetical protein DM860_012495 [Cuscuta australis]|uniref:Uncharacterized protein n=1 Tax=Cuscuta australis TaxID=267555 RepID=A0A328DCV3_9ASTE|nr:hypothetical protein DM860_012495 [Cuscuta australis]
MLQWMGGSRRKVTTSRNSTLKRQKQYFEQRRQKHQHHQTDVENYHGNNQYNQQLKNNKSLDVLSLLNLSVIPGESNSVCHQGKSEGDALILDYQTKLYPQTAHTNEVTQISPPRIKLEENSPCDLADMECVRNFPVGALESQKKRLKGDWNTLNQSKLLTENQLSVIDILDDDGPSSNLEQDVGHEGHVAFSVQGLGKVNAETPIHSPERPVSCRNFSYGQCLPLKERVKTHSSIKTTGRPDGLNHELATTMRDIRESIYKSSEPSFCSSSIDDLFCCPKQDLFSNKKLSKVSDYDTNLDDIFEDDELFGNERKKNSQNATSSFLPYGICDQEEYGFPCKGELDELEFCSSHPADRSNDHQDFYFESHQWKSTRMQPPFEINYRDSPSLFSKHQTQHYFEDSDPNIKCNYSIETRGYCFVENKKRTAPSCSASDDMMDNLSFPSEESCFFSAAVKGDLLGSTIDHHDMDNLLHKNAMETKNRFCNGDGWTESFSDYPTTAQERWPDQKNHGLISKDLHSLDEDFMGFTREHLGCSKQLPLEEPNIIPKPAIIIISNTISAGPSVPNLFQPKSSFHKTRECISQASMVSSSSDQLGDHTTKEPKCITPDVTETTNNGSKSMMEQADEASSCADIAAGDQGKVISE